MRFEFLKAIMCPYCGEDIQTEDAIESTEKEITTGIVSCACNRYPIIAGILNLRPGRLNDYIVQMLRERELDRAVGIVFLARADLILGVSTLMISMKTCGAVLARVLLLILRSRALRAYHRFEEKDLSFYDFVGDGSFQAYLKHRFSAESFWSLYPFVRLLKENAEWILDLGCGAGHGSFVISSCVRPDRLVCADHQLRNLFMVKRFFVPDAECICLDADYPLPFRDKIFSSVLMLESFQYVRSHASLAGELQRILADQGILLILHFLNSLGQDAPEGYPLPPKTLMNLFRGRSIRIMPEQDLIERFMKENCLDLTKTYPEAELNNSNAVALVTSDNRRAFRQFLNVADEFLECNSNLVINPIYQVEVKSNKLVMRRHLPGEFFRGEISIGERYLPESCVIEGELADDIEEKGRLGPKWTSSVYDSRTRELMRQFVLINVPGKYL